MYRPALSIYTPPPAERWHRNALDWWVYCYGWIPMSRNAQIRGLVSTRWGSAPVRPANTRLRHRVAKMRRERLRQLSDCAID